MFTIKIKSESTESHNFLTENKQLCHINDPLFFKTYTIKHTATISEFFSPHKSCLLFNLLLHDYIAEITMILIGLFEYHILMANFHTSPKRPNWRRRNKNYLQYLILTYRRSLAVSLCSRDRKYVGVSLVADFQEVCVLLKETLCHVRLH